MAQKRGLAISWSLSPCPLRTKEARGSASPRANDTADSRAWNVPTASTPRGLSAAELLLFGLMDANCRLRGYSVHAAVTEPELADHERLVQLTFFGQGYYRSTDTALKIDPPGSESHAWLARYKGESIGTIRLIRNERQWPVDLVYPFELPSDVSRCEGAEIGRFNIVPAHRRRRFVVSFALLKAAFAFSRRNGIRWWIGCAPAPLIMAFRAHSPGVRLLTPLPVEACHLKERAGREQYFSSSQSIRAFLIDLNDLDVYRVARRMLWQRFRQGNLWTYKRAARDLANAKSRNTMPSISQETIHDTRER